MQFYTQVIQDAGGHPIAFANKAQQYVLGANIIVVEALRLFLGELQHLSGSFCKFIESICHLFSPSGRYVSPSDYG